MMMSSPRPRLVYQGGEFSCLALPVICAVCYYALCEERGECTLSQMQCGSGGLRLSSLSPFARWLILRHSCTKLFVGGLSYDTNESVLKDAFGQHGEIIEVKVICDHVTGKSKGYGFVQFNSETAAGTALREMDGQLLDGRRIRIHYGHKG